MKIRACLYMALFVMVSVVKGQQLDSMLSVYHDNYQPEKIYLQYDKSVYSGGDTIWYKAYILAGASVSDYSRNLYADWYNDAGILIVHTVMPVFESSARGQFSIPAAYHGQSLTVKVYTRWMLNFDTGFIYKRTLQVTGQSTGQAAKAIPPSVTIHFFPEGGDMIAGIESSVAFLVADQAGRPVEAKGAIVTETQQLVDSIATTHDGMGKFIFQPAAGVRYFCNWIDASGHSHTSALPEVKTTGLVISAVQSGEKLLFSVQRSVDAPGSFQNIHLVASMYQEPLYNAAINLTTRNRAAGIIQTGRMETGVLLLTAFDADWTPVSERAVFINNGLHEFHPDIHILSQKLAKRGLNELQVSVADTVLSNLSVSITDADLFTDSSETIFSRFLLNGELKGSVYNAAAYFRNVSDSTRYQLDLVMLTHGWRRIHWEDIVHAKMPLLPYPVDSDYLQIRGQVLTNGQLSIPAGQNISLVMQAKDSSKQFFLLPLSQNGQFHQRGLIFYDTSRIYYQFNGNRKLQDLAMTRFQYGLPQVPYAARLVLPQAATLDTGEVQYDNLLHIGMMKSRQRTDSAFTLAGVTVYAKARTAMDVLNEKYTTGIFTTNNGYAFDVQSDPRSQGSLDLFHYLQLQIPGLSMSLPALGTNGAEDANSDNLPGLTWRDGTPALFLNEMPTDVQTLMGLQMTDIAYVKAFRPPFMGSTGSSPSGAIAVYTKKAEDINLAKIKGLSSALLAGYTAYKEFYEPDYAIALPKFPDMRSTLYWNPYILIDRKKKSYNIRFYNNDITKRIRIVLEGVNAAGKLARVEKLIEKEEN